MAMAIRVHSQLILVFYKETMAVIVRLNWFSDQDIKFIFPIAEVLSIDFSLFFRGY